MRLPLMRSSGKALSLEPPWAMLVLSVVTVWSVTHSILSSYSERGMGGWMEEEEGFRHDRLDKREFTAVHLFLSIKHLKCNSNCGPQTSSFSISISWGACLKGRFLGSA